MNQADILRPWQNRLHEIIFEADTPAGKRFDILLIWSIGISVLVVMLDSVASVRQVWGHQLYLIEWFFTIVFTVEYVLTIILCWQAFSLCYQFFWDYRFTGGTSDIPRSIASWGSFLCW